MVAIFDGILHTCPLSESGIPLLEYGCLNWEPLIQANASDDFIEEAKYLLQKPFLLKS